MWNLKNQTKYKIKEKQTHRYRGKNVGYPKGLEGGRLRKIGEGDENIQALSYKTSHGDVTHIIVNSIVKTLYGDRW